MIPNPIDFFLKYYYTYFNSPLYLWAFLGFCAYVYANGGFKNIPIFKNQVSHVFRCNQKILKFCILPKKRDAPSTNYQQQETPATTVNREAFLSRMQAQIDKNAAERKDKTSDTGKQLAEEEKRKRLEKIAKYEAQQKGATFTGVGQTIGNDKKSKPKTLRDDSYNPLGGNTSNNDACRYRPGMGRPARGG